MPTHHREPSFSTSVDCSREQRSRRRWLRRSLIGVCALAIVVFLGACSSALYIRALWTSGNYRCGEALARYGGGKALSRYDGWHIGFNGKTDAFVCTVYDVKVRVVAQKEIPVEQLMGRSGSLPLFPALMAHELESVDGDLP